MSDSIHIFGIRHHGPGSARSLRRALDELQPDIVLLEGPADVEEPCQFAANPDLKPPVALLIYRPDAPSHAVYFPFAEFSPEWQAIQFAVGHNTPWRFIDLPQCISMAEQAAKIAKVEKPEETSPLGEASPESPGTAEETTQETETPSEETSGEQTSEPPESEEPFDLPRDPLQHIAAAAGYTDSERWWEHHFEERLDATGVFKAVLEMMTAVRADTEACNPLSPREARREAHMRQEIRAALKEGFQRIVVVVGAWHAPAIAKLSSIKAKADADLLRGLTKVKVTATWVPWTHGRLTRASGYGAGIHSPGYYQHLWTSSVDSSIRWMAKVGQFLRKRDLEASTAGVIEASRLADTLAALRGRHLAGLSEFNEAAQSVFCFGDATPMRLIHDELIVGETLGSVPAETPALPLQMHLRKEQKRLRLQPEASSRVLELDLRKPTDLERSQLLHRLNLLSVPWGKVDEFASRGKGTFRENWRLAWDPDFEVRVIEATVFGNTLEHAASQSAIEKAAAAEELRELTSLIGKLLFADLPEAIQSVAQSLENAAAITSDTAQLMAALPPLVNAFRYGSVRQLNANALAHVVHGLIARICIGLIPASSSLNDEAAAEFLKDLDATNTAIDNLDDPAERELWISTLSRLASAPNLHGLIAGRCCRILMDREVIDYDETQRRLSLALSAASGTLSSAAWLDGFLSGSGLLLIHTPALWETINFWVASLNEERFVEVLPILRRTFSSFELPERKQIGQLAQKGGSGNVMHTGTAMVKEEPLNRSRAGMVMPIITTLLGLQFTPGEQKTEEAQP